MLTITAITHDRLGRIIKVRIDGINREASEIVDLILSGAETATARSGGNSFNVEAVDSPVAGRFLRGHAGASLESLPAAPLTLVTFGDSVAWGLGLRRNRKHAALVVGRLSRSNRGTSVITLNLANSGARIGPVPARRSNFTIKLDTLGDNTLGEVMDGTITTHKQIDAFLATGPDVHPAPEAVDYILLSAGSNDVGLDRILSFLKNDVSITRLVRGGMTTSMDGLLHHMLNTFPNARIFVTGYYPIITAKSWPHNVAELLLAIQYLTKSRPSPFATITNVARANMILNCKTFADEYELALNTLVQTINASMPHERLFFSRPSFAPRHALFGPPRMSRLFRLNAGGFPTDETARIRGPLCDSAFSRLSGANIQCRVSSVGHPNVTGARAYFRAIRTNL